MVIFSQMSAPLAARSINMLCAACTSRAECRLLCWPHTGQISHARHSWLLTAQLKPRCNLISRSNAEWLAGKCRRVDVGLCGRAGETLLDHVSVPQRGRRPQTRGLTSSIQCRTSGSNPAVGVALMGLASLARVSVTFLVLALSLPGTPMCATRQMLM